MSTLVSDLTLPVPGGSVFARRWDSGPGHSSPIILMHDSLGCVELWRDFPAELSQATSRPVIAYDRLGFGKSERRTTRPSPDFVREEAEIIFPALRRELGIDRFVLLGHSVGGAMALSTAGLHTESCDALITEAAQTFVEARTVSGIRLAKEQFSNSQDLARLERYHGDKASWVLDAWTEVWLSPEFASWSVDAFLPGVRCPVLAIHGDRDDYGTLEFPRHIARRVSGPVELAILDDCGHVPHRERRAEVVGLIAAFLASRT